MLTYVSSCVTLCTNIMPILHYANFSVGSNVIRAYPHDQVTSTEKYFKDSSYLGEHKMYSAMTRKGGYITYIS